MNNLFDESVPLVKAANLDVRLDQKHTFGGMTTTLVRAYADENNVVVGYRFGGSDELSSAKHMLPKARLVDTTGRDFTVVDSRGAVRNDGGSLSMKRTQVDAVTIFEACEKLTVSGEHGFHLMVELLTSSSESTAPEAEAPMETCGGSFDFDFKIPVWPITVLEVGREQQTKGLSLSLERVESSPAKTRAFIRFMPPDIERSWIPIVKTAFFKQGRLADTPMTETRCASFSFQESLHGKPGKYSLTVTEIVGFSPDRPEKDKRIHGPWRFRFEIPIS